MCTNKKQKCAVIIGGVVCIVLAGAIILAFILKSRQVEKIDCSHIPVQKQQKDVYFQIDEVGFDEHGVLYITAEAENAKIKYSYKNWVLGEGKNVYRKSKIVLVDDEHKVAYKLPTYPHATPSQSEKGEGSEIETATTTGLVAYAPKKLMKKGPFSIAVLFEDREKNETILYPKEEQIVNEE
ncbi:MAG: hypothetical protein ACI4HI_12670 [Lachnospiraceae bacterium]